MIKIQRLEIFFKDNTKTEYILEDTNQEVWFNAGFMFITVESGTDSYALSIIDKFFVRHIGG